MGQRDPDALASAVASEADAAMTTASLAHWFGLRLSDFVDALGGDWLPVEVMDGVGVLEASARWFGAGSPLQVLLGLTPRFAVVAVPIESGPGLAGPGGVSLGETVAIDLNDTEHLDGLREAVDFVLAQSRRDWSWCQACRPFLPAFPVPGLAGAYCAGCQERYLGVIAC